MYIPGHGCIERRQVQWALAEFHHRLEAGESDVEVVVATGVPLLKMFRRLEIINCGAIFEARFDNIGEVDGLTTAEVIVIKTRCQTHQVVVTTISAQLGNYSRDMNYSIQAGGGAQLLAGRMRKPDCALSPDEPIPGEDPTMYRVIVEVELPNRSLPTANIFCRQYFQLIQQVQAVLLLEIFGRRINSTFAALAVLYRRIGNDVIVADAVSFGTAPLSRETEQTMPANITGIVRQLPIPTQAQVQTGNPWNVTSNPFVTIPMNDIFYLSPGRMLASSGPGVRTDLKIDLYKVLRSIINCKW